MGSYVGADNMYDFAKYTLNNESLSATDADYGPIVLGGQTQGLSTLELAASYQIFYDGKYTTPKPPGSKCYWGPAHGGGSSPHSAPCGPQRYRMVYPARRWNS